jgi:sirohydrochlorin cobaltochelatase
LHVADELALTGVTSICIVPLFLGVGKHAREDLPILMSQVQSSHPQLTVTCQRAVGEQERLLDLLAEISLKGEA